MSVDIRSYLPDVIRDFREFITLSQAENPELAELWNGVGDTMDNQFIQDSTEEGIARFEKLVKVTPFASDTLPERKFRVLAEWSANLPYTERRFNEMLENLCGKDGYILTINRPDHTALIKVALISKKNVTSVKKLAERVVPAEMVITVELLYNTWGQVKEKTWGYIKNKTWKDTKEEVL
ncbi:MAG: putative phage tail protein [Candidatus Metalachnospira sp.]|nr:putative phage tail protein [Candidatus Metalachnospira sp.]